MESESSSHELISDLLKATDVVRSLYQQTNNQYSLLKHKAQQLKNQIQDDVSLHLELLRNREVWLLDQVDILLQLKEESLEGQQKELFVLLAKLEIYLELLQTRTVEGSAEVEVEVKKLISSIKSLDISVDESSNVGFLANNIALTDAIKNFGSIAEDQPDVKMSTDQEKDHGSFKFFQGHMSTSPEDWLAPSSKAARKQPQTNKKELTGFEQFCKTLAQSDYKNWLYKEDQSIDVQSAVTNFCENFYEVMQEPASQWLSQTSATSSQVTTSSHPLHPISHHVSEPPENWLLTTKTAETSECRSVVCNDEPGDSDQPDSIECEIVTVPSKDIVIEDGWLLSSDNADRTIMPNESGISLKLSEMSITSSGEELPPPDNNLWIRRLRKSLRNSSNIEWLLQPESEPAYCDWLSNGSIRCSDCPGDENCPREVMKVFREIQKTPREEWLKTATDW